MVDGKQVEEQKDQIFQEFLDGLKKIRKGFVPNRFRDTTYFLGHASKYFSKSKQRDIQTMIEVANEQLPYVQALEYVKITQPEHKRREKRLSRFLRKYNTYNKKYSK